MRRSIVNGVAALVLLLAGCNLHDSDNPNYPSSPYLEFPTLTFTHGNTGTADTLTVSFKITDAEFDLGLDVAELDSPYHQFNYFLDPGSNQLHKVVTKKINDEVNVIFPEKQTGTLATHQSLRRRLFPAPQVTCKDYTVGPFTYVSSVNKDIIDPATRIVDTLHLQPDVYQLSDTFYIEKNEGYYNIEVLVWVQQQANGDFTPFDFTPYCTTFNGRFPLVETLGTSQTAKSGPFIIKRLTQQTGTLTYAMTSLGFRSLFGGKNIKLQILVRDRFLQESNLLETPAVMIN